VTIKPDALRQLLQCLNRAATTAQVFSVTDDVLYLSYSTIMSKVKFNRRKRISFVSFYRVALLKKMTMMMELKKLNHFRNKKWKNKNYFMNKID
jgi:hypothetical protein